MDIFLPVLIVTVIGLIAGLGLSLASKFMAVKTDDRQEKIRECLPGANCGACGYTGCDGYAAAIACGDARADLCAPGGASTAAALAELLGVEVDSVPKAAFIACGASSECVGSSFEYTGMESCAAANLVQGGPLECKYGCLGFGDCAKSCPFGAINMADGRPHIDSQICLACGKCVAVCPKSLISVLPKGNFARVACSNTQKGPAVVKACKTSCIACGMCERVCPTGAVRVTDNVAVIDASACTGCGKCKEACKRGAIL